MTLTQAQHAADVKRKADRFGIPIELGHDGVLALYIIAVMFEVSFYQSAEEIRERNLRMTTDELVEHYDACSRWCFGPQAEGLSYNEQCRRVRRDPREIANDYANDQEGRLMSDAEVEYWRSEGLLPESDENGSQSAL